jgi:hypothetical protein
MLGIKDSYNNGESPLSGGGWEVDFYLFVKKERQKERVEEQKICVRVE